MNEVKWLSCTDPRPMLKLFREKRLDPRLRRFAVECCRRVRHLIYEEVFRAAAFAAEAFADDPRNEKSTIRAMAMAAIQGWGRRRRYAATADPRHLHASDAALLSCAPTNWHAAVNASRAAALAANREATDSLSSHELRYQAALLRCLFGPHPFRSIPFHAAWVSWNRGIVADLARSIHEDHAFDRLPILADALEEAGCDDASILAHCRGPGPHCKGCWVVDGLRAKG